MSRDDAIEKLKDLQKRLELHFAQLRRDRGALDSDWPVFALEHPLLSGELGDLKSAVRQVVAEGFEARSWRLNWLPFVVYAAEVGYAYVGDEYWPTFQNETPGWSEFGDRALIRVWFQRFRDEYGGAVPEGAFARNFSIIAWPITHAVLPVYLQRNLARLLFDTRMGVSADLLDDPESLGRKLASRAWGYTERFRLFCENTTLLGHIAASLLLGEGEESPYLLKDTLSRLVEGLNQESQAKEWLRGARGAAFHARTRGFRSKDASGSGHVQAVPEDRLPKSTSPRMELRNSQDGWRVYVGLPDLSSLRERLPRNALVELRNRRALVEGAAETILARGRLTMPGQELQLTTWPNPDRPFIQLEDGDAQTNTIIRDHVAITSGPVWVFKRRAPGLASQVRGNFVRPGGIFYIIHTGSWMVPDLPWAQRVRLLAEGAEAVKLSLPMPLTEDESIALVGTGLSLASEVAIRPVGCPAIAWDGEGTVEWLAGEPVLVGISAEQVPSTAVIEVDGRRHVQPWPEKCRELFLRVNDLSVGEHLLQVELQNAHSQLVVKGDLAVGVRDARHLETGAGVGEGIRLLVSPPRPTMSELWEPGALSILGPENLKANLRVTMRDDKGQNLGVAHAEVTLPLLDSDWVRVARTVRANTHFTRKYDQAESIELAVSRAGVGYAAVTADRGFQPLRWKLIQRQGGSWAHLIDRTDSGGTKVELFRVESPLVAVPCEANSDIVAPDTGGLLHASAVEGVDATATLLLPTNPTTLIEAGRANPEIQTSARTAEEVNRLVVGHQLWAQADSPADWFAEYQRQTVLEAISRALVCLVGGRRWAAVERRLAHADDRRSLIRDMRVAVGETYEQQQLAQSIEMNLHSWREPNSLDTGFATAMQRTLRVNNLDLHDSAPRFLLRLASQPGLVSRWQPKEREALLQAAITTPLLLRAARFAWLGTRLLSDDDEEHRFQ